VKYTKKDVWYNAFSYKYNAAAKMQENGLN